MLPLASVQTKSELDVCKTALADATMLTDVIGDKRALNFLR
jgi:hypothetical protein